MDTENNFEFIHRTNQMFDVLINEINSIDRNNNDNDLKYGSLVKFVKQVKSVAKKNKATYALKRDIKKMCSLHNLDFDFLWNDKLDFSKKKSGYQGGTDLIKTYNLEDNR